jgi:ParB family chromosome partitioning protein
MEFLNNAIFWVEVEKIRPNPFQPRKEFDEARLRDLADSIRMYGVLQPLVVTRKEFQKEDGGLGVEYELISGERRLRASKLAGIPQVPVLIRSSEESDRVKLELAIIENLQREDLNSVDRAHSFERLVKEFNLTHADIGRKMGKSREYVSNTLRLLLLPANILQALSEGKISEGHTRPILMLVDKPEEQAVLFKEIILKRMPVREAELIARKIAFERARKKERMFDPDIIELEQKLTETLGTRVSIEQKNVGGKIHIDFFSPDDLRTILETIQKKVDAMGSAAKIGKQSIQSKAEGIKTQAGSVGTSPTPIQSAPLTPTETVQVAAQEVVAESIADTTLIDDRSKQEINEDENTEDLYSVKNFSL